MKCKFLVTAAVLLASIAACGLSTVSAQTADSNAPSSLPGDLVYNLGWNNVTSSWDRIRTGGSTDNSGTTPNTGIVKNQNFIYNGSAGNLVPMSSFGSSADANAGANGVSVGASIYNGTTWDRVRSANGAGSAGAVGVLASAPVFWGGAAFASQLSVGGSGSVDNINAVNTPVTPQYIYNGAGSSSGWDRQRTPIIFKTLSAVAVGSEITIWTPAAGKKFRLMGFILSAGTAAGNITLKDNTAGSTIFIIPKAPLDTTISPPTFGNGILSAAANNVLTATGVATETLSGTIWGTEE